MSEDAVGRAEIEAAERLIRPHIRRTPIIEIDAGDFGLKLEPLRFKLEFLQHTGSFKARGAFNSLLSRAVPAAGVAAASGGNHGAAVAFAAGRLGIPARIFVPTIASPAKIAQIRSYGADLVVGGERYVEALAACEAFVRDTGALNIHAYDQVETLRGQGTVGLELEGQARDIDTLLVAVGGGGLIAGIAAWFQGRVKVVGVEPELAPTLTKALAAGRPVDAEAGGVAADSLAPKRVGELVYPIAERHVAGTVLVEDAAIVQAQKDLWRVIRVVAEPGGAAAFAALQSRRYVPKIGERMGVLLCGANTSAVSFPD